MAKQVLGIIYPAEISGGMATKDEEFNWFPLKIINEEIADRATKLLDKAKFIDLTKTPPLETPIQFGIFSVEHFKDDPAEYAQLIYDLEQDLEDHAPIIVEAKKAADRCIASIEALGEIKKTGVHTQETANIAITKLLPELKDKMDLKKITARFLAKEIGCSSGLISQSPAWIAFKNKRDGKQKSSSKSTRLNAIHLDNIRADTQTPDEIAEENELKALLADQEADMNNQDGPNKSFPDR